MRGVAAGSDDFGEQRQLVATCGTPRCPSSGHEAPPCATRDPKFSRLCAATPVATSALAPRADVVRRKKAAHILGISETTLRRRYEGKALPVHVDETGVHVFALSVVEAFARELRIVTTEADASADPNDGEAARSADVFALFDEGVHPVDVVKKLRTVLPAFVESAYAQWLRMRGGLVLTPDHVTSLRRSVAWSSPRSPRIETANDLVALVKDVLEAPPRTRVCLLCAKKTATVCATCLGREQNNAQRSQREHEREMKKMDADAEKARAGYAREAAESARERGRDKQHAHERNMAELAARRARGTGG